MKEVNVPRYIKGDAGSVALDFKAHVHRDYNIYGDDRYLMPFEVSINGVKLCYADMWNLWDATVTQAKALEEMDDEEFEQRRMMDES